MAIPADDNTFSMKYELYSNMIYKLALLYLNNSMDCEDVMQEVFIKLLSKRTDFTDPEHEKRWLIRIAINSCLDKIRRNKRNCTLPLEEGIFVTNTSEEEELVYLVLKLPDKLKAPLHLYYYEGYKVNEISKILGVKTSAIKMRLKRGRDLLKIELEEEVYER